MEKNPIQKKIKDFTNYLEDIGLLASINVPDFLTKFKTISENNTLSSGMEETDFNIALIYLKDNISKTMVEIYDAMSNERKKIISINVYSKYLEKKNINLEKRSNALFKLSNKITKKIYFTFWKNNIEKQREIKIRYKYLYKIEKFYFSICKRKTNNRNAALKSNQNIDNLFLKSNYYKDINAKNLTKLKNPKENSFNIKNKNNEIISSLEKKKFLIKNTNPSNKSNNSLDVFERLYKPRTPNNSKFMEPVKFKKYLNRNNTSDYIESYTQSNNSTSKSQFLQNFNQRLKASSQKKNNDIEQLTELMEEDFRQRFTFKPKINSSNNITGNKEKRANSEDKKQMKKSSSVYERLYEENKKIQQKKADRVREQAEEFKKKANKPLIKNRSYHTNQNKKYNNKYTVIFGGCNNNHDNNANTPRNLFNKQNVAKKIDEILLKNILSKKIDKKIDKNTEENKVITGNSASKKMTDNNNSDSFPNIHILNNKNNNSYTDTQIQCQKIIEEAEKNENKENKEDKEEIDKDFSEKEILINKLFIENKKHKQQKNNGNNFNQNGETINDKKK